VKVRVRVRVRVWASPRVRVTLTLSLTQDYLNSGEEGKRTLGLSKSDRD